jgi:hypothetical protein
MITRISGVIRPKGSDLIFDHPYNADYLPDDPAGEIHSDGAQIRQLLR